VTAQLSGSLRVSRRTVPSGGVGLSSPQAAAPGCLHLLPLRYLPALSFRLKFYAGSSPSPANLPLLRRRLPAHLRNASTTTDCQCGPATVPLQAPGNVWHAAPDHPPPSWCQRHQYDQHLSVPFELESGVWNWRGRAQSDLRERVFLQVLLFFR